MNSALGPLYSQINSKIFHSCFSYFMSSLKGQLGWNLFKPDLIIWTIPLLVSS